jgi:hypothetical protein
MKAIVAPSGESLGVEQVPKLTVKRVATPPVAATLQRSSSQTNTMRSPEIVGYR